MYLIKLCKNLWNLHCTKIWISFVIFLIFYSKKEFFAYKLCSKKYIRGSILEYIDHVYTFDLPMVQTIQNSNKSVLIHQQYRYFHEVSNAYWFDVIWFNINWRRISIETKYIPKISMYIYRYFLLCILNWSNSINSTTVIRHLTFL